MLQLLMREHPTYGYRRLWALLRYRLGIMVNRKRIYRILKAKRRLVHQRTVTPRSRVKASVSRTTKSDRRWAMDMTHVDCGRVGWAHLVRLCSGYLSRLMSPGSPQGAPPGQENGGIRRKTMSNYPAEFKDTMISKMSMALENCTFLADGNCTHRPLDGEP